MALHLKAVLLQAFSTFDPRLAGNFEYNFSQLKTMIDHLKLSHIESFDVRLLSDDAFVNSPPRAPVKMVHIFEDKFLIVGILILRGNFTLPLHDHPNMHGLLRCVYGRLLVQSYTAVMDEPSVVTVTVDGSKTTGRRVIAESPVILDVNSKCAVLTPRQGNYHEITALDGVAAFFDVLSPPYGRAGFDRECGYYKATTLEGNKYLLERIPEPDDFHNDYYDIRHWVMAACCGRNYGYGCMPITDTSKGYLETHL